MTVAAAAPDDPRRDLVARLVLALAHVRRQKRKVNRALTKAHDADARLQSEVALAMLRFQKDCEAALDRWAKAKGIQ